MARSIPAEAKEDPKEMELATAPNTHNGGP